MVKAFLSHSSQDKSNYVEIVANTLGRSVAIYDKISFEAGAKTIQEIVKGIDGALIFVLFISDSSLNSKWVQFEIEKAREHLAESARKYFLPIIVDPIIAYDDPRIPVWVKENYNLRYLKPKGALRAIQSKIREVSWGIKPELKERENIFHGRHEERNKFSLRYYATDKPKPISCLASGIKNIGKLSFLKRCLTENRISPSQYYEYPEISLNSDESLENFIQYSLDLDIASHPPISNLAVRPYEEKIEILSNIYKNLNNPTDIIAIRDNSCIIRRNGEVAEWFIDFIRSISSLNSVYFIISCESSPRNIVKMDDIVFWTKIAPLNKEEQRVLLVNYLESIFKLNVPKSDIETSLMWVQGYPRQIFYLAQIFSESNGSFSYVKNRSHDVFSFGADFSGIAIQKYASIEKAKEVLALLACAVGVRKDFLIEAFKNDKDKINYLNEFELMSICYSVGSSNEYILLDGILRDAVQRLRYKPNKAEYESLISQVKKNIHDANQEDIFSKSCYIEQTLISGKDISLEFVLPSHFIAAIKQSYHSQNYKHAIFLCNKLYESGAVIDNNIIQIVRFYECMAKIKDNKDISALLPLHKEPERSFLKGFQARTNGDFRSALHNYRTAYEKNRDYTYARNEYISLKIQFGEADEVTPIAKEEYDKNKSNIYVAQAYFNCLLSIFKKSFRPDTISEIERVINYLPDVSDGKLLQMNSCMCAEHAFYVEKNHDKAFEILEECESKVGENIYLLFIKESFFSHSGKLKKAQDTLDRIKVIRRNENAFTDRIAKAQALIYARGGNYEAAEHVCHSGLKNYPVETKNSYLEYLYRVASGSNSKTA